MAHGRSLELRQIQPRDHASAHKPNGARRMSKAAAKAAGVSRRRWLKAERRRKQAAA